MRGKHCISKFQFLPFGITPAHAGKTIVGSYAVTRFRDHPRACGENKEQVLQDFFSGGSPPRMRGKLEYRVEGETNLRITPAHAGKTAKAYEAWQELWDHPRACGENRLKKCALRRVLGSPPRMRGKRLFGEPFKAEAGITPAHAGKTRF